MQFGNSVLRTNFKHRRKQDNQVDNQVELRKQEKATSIQSLRRKNAKIYEISEQQAWQLNGKATIAYDSMGFNTGNRQRDGIATGNVGSVGNAG